FPQRRMGFQTALKDFLHIFFGTLFFVIKIYKRLASGNIIIEIFFSVKPLDFAENQSWNPVPQKDFFLIMLAGRSLIFMKDHVADPADSFVIHLHYPITLQSAVLYSIYKISCLFNFFNKENRSYDFTFYHALLFPF